jgi:ADP-heptose:LPS heptosyltransferase
VLIDQDKSIKILIQRADRFGDTVLSFPIVDSIIKNHPKVTIDYLVSNEGKSAIELQPNIKKYWVFDSNHPLNSFLKLKNKLKNEKYDIFISLWNQDIFAFLGFYLNIPIRIGYKKKLIHNLFYTHLVRQEWNDFSKHEIEFNFMFLAKLGFKLKTWFSEIIVKEPIKLQIKEELKTVFGSSAKIILIFTETGGSNIAFPKEVIDDFINKIGEKKEYSIVLAGKLKDNKYKKERYSEHVLNKIGQTTVPQLAAFIDLADYYIGPDTGPTHIASFLKKPMIFFSPLKKNPPIRYGSLSPVQKIIRHDYHYPHLEIQKKDLALYLNYLTGDYLVSVFNNLVNDNLNKAPLSLEETKCLHRVHSFRILYIKFSDEEEAKLNSYLEICKGYEFKVFCVSWRGMKSLNHVLNLLRTYNINILHGNFPKLLPRFIFKYQEAVNKTMRPIYVNERITSKTVDYWLEYYCQKFKQPSSI